MFRVDLPDVEKMRRFQKNVMSPAEMREFMKEQGMLPPTRDSEQQIYVSSTGGIVEQFVPPEGDGKVSLLSKEVRKTNSGGYSFINHE